MLPDDQGPFAKTVFQVSANLQGMDPGSLARLRRMDPEGPGEGDFWTLALATGLRTDSAGLRLVRQLALLTPRGAVAGRRLHVRNVAFGRALAEAGYPEMRLLRFLALPLEARGAALERMVRWLAAKGHHGVNCVDLACLLTSGDPRHTRRLAQTYFDARRSDADDDGVTKPDTADEKDDIA